MGSTVIFVGFVIIGSAANNSTSSPSTTCILDSAFSGSLFSSSVNNSKFLLSRERSQFNKIRQIEKNTNFFSIAQRIRLETRKLYQLLTLYPNKNFVASPHTRGALHD